MLSNAVNRATFFKALILICIIDFSVKFVYPSADVWAAFRVRLPASVPNRERVSETMSKDLERMSVPELDALIVRAQLVREETRDRRRTELKSEIVSKLKSEGFTAIEVLGAKVKPKSQTLPPKYIDPNDATLTWSGKGRMPGWLQDKIHAGTTLDAFLLK